jgi:hypothetical protein
MATLPQAVRGWRTPCCPGLPHGPARLNVNRTLAAIGRGPSRLEVIPAGCTTVGPRGPPCCWLELRWPTHDGPNGQSRRKRLASGRLRLVLSRARIARVGHSVGQRPVDPPLQRVLLDRSRGPAPLQDPGSPGRRRRLVAVASKLMMRPVFPAISCTRGVFCLAADGEHETTIYSSGRWRDVHAVMSPQNGPAINDVSCTAQVFWMLVDRKAGATRCSGNQWGVRDVVAAERSSPGGGSSFLFHPLPVNSAWPLGPDGPMYSHDRWSCGEVQPNVCLRCRLRDEHLLHKRGPSSRQIATYN